MTRAIGRYELVRPLARGGMAEVFLARRRAGGVEKLLVVKRIRAERAGDPRFLDMFMKEARLSMSLAHQNIVPVFDFGRAGDQVFLAMERVEGKDLGSSLARAARQPPSPLIAAFIAAECCQALDYAHRRKNPDGTNRGVVHRDVTPRNVLLSWSGEVKLTDFGIASVAGEDTSKLVGTPSYMSPEQARGETVDVRTDLYAVGMVLREALTGERARPGEDREALLAAARIGTLAPWPDNELDPTLIAIVDRATATARDDRYAGANEMLADLDAYIVAERAKKRGESPPRQIAAWLAQVWGAEREESIEPDTTLEPGAAMMSFLDDGHGTGTQRSLAATAADDPDLAPVSELAAKAASGSEPDAGASAAAAADPAAPPRAGESKPDPASPKEGVAGVSSAASIERDAATAEAAATPEVESAPSRRRVIIVGTVVIAASALAFVATRDRGVKPSPVRDAALIASAPDASISPDAVAIEADATTVEPDAASPADADLRAGSDSREGSARAGSAVRAGSNTRVGSGSARVGPGSARVGDGSARVGPGSARAGSGSAVAAGSGSARAGSGSAKPAGNGSAVGLRKVRINATPWAYFTVDGGPRMQTPKLLELAPGPHKIHFENAVLKVERTITLDVPVDRDISYVEPLGR
jgi:serine/threonine protein kinase